MQKTKQLLEKYWFVPVILIAIPLYGMNLNYGDLWNDETFTKELVSFPLPQLFELLANDYHPPLYFLVLKLFVALFGSSAIALRAFSTVGVFATLFLILRVGSRVLGKKGALLLGLISLTLPMQATFAHTARMYTWASFATTGVFLFALAEMRAPSRRNMVALAGFTLLGAYIHYYCVFAAICAHLFVFIHGLIKKNHRWKPHLISLLVVAAAYLPWTLTLLYQVGRVHQDYYLEPVNLQLLLQCYVLPFFHTAYPSPLSKPLLAAFAFLSLAAVMLIVWRRSEHRLPLALSLTVFNGTVLIAILVSFVLRPILFYRYMATMMVMLAVPPALFLLEVRRPLIRRLLLAGLLVIGLLTAYDAGKETVGPYRSVLHYIKENHPEVTKVYHPAELTIGPSLEYNAIGPWTHYWLANTESVFYTNIGVYRELHQVSHLDEMLEEGEVFCMLDVVGMPLNRENVERVMSSSEQLASEIFRDDKVTVASAQGLQIQVYALRYRGAPSSGVAEE